MGSAAKGTPSGPRDSFFSPYLPGFGDGLLGSVLGDGLLVLPTHLGVSGLAWL